MIRGIYILLFCFCVSVGVAQESALIVQKHPSNNGMELKWFVEGIRTVGGIHVFKKENEEWKKITIVAVKPQKSITEEATEEEKEFSEIAKTIKGNKADGMALLFLLNGMIKYESIAKELGTYFLDTTAVEGELIQYQIRSISGNVLAESIPIAVEVYQAIDSPDSVEIWTKKRTAYFKWKPEIDRYYGVDVFSTVNNIEIKLNDYPILASEKQDSTKQLVSSDFYYEMPKLKEDSTYQVYFKAIDFFGNYSKVTKEFSFTIKDQTPPLAPSNFRVITTQKTATVFAWDNPEYGETVHLELWRSKTYDGEYEKRAVFEGVTNEGRIEASETGNFYYILRSVDLAGNFNESLPLTLEQKDLLAPNAPLGVFAIADTGTIQITWKTNVETDLKGYEIYSGVDSIKLIKAVSFPLTDTSYSLEIPKQLDRDVFIALKAIDTNDNRSNYSKIIQVKPIDSTPCEQPIVYSIERNKDTLQVKWMENVEIDFATYEVAIYNSTKDSLIESRKLTSINYQFAPTLKQEGRAFAQITALDETGNRSIASDWIKLPQTNSELPTLQLKGKKKKSGLILSWKLPTEHPYKYLLLMKKTTLGEEVVQTELKSNDKISVPKNSLDGYFLKGITEKGRVQLSNKI